MKFVSRFTILTATALALASAAAFAQEAATAPQPPMQQADEQAGEGWRQHKHGRGDHDGKGPHGRGGRMMRMIDANADGVIGDEEAAAMADHGFMRMDDNRDGSLTEAEFVAGPGRGHGRGWFSWSSEETAAVEKVRKDKFASLDTDKNAALSKTEFFAEAKALLASADTDKDGKVTPWEFRAAMPSKH